MAENNGKKSCPETDSTLILYLYGEATDPEAFEKHLASCSQCRAELEKYRSLLDKYRDIPPGSDFVNTKEVVEHMKTLVRWSGIRDLFWPLAGFAVATMVLIFLLLPTDSSRNVNGYLPASNIEEPLDEIDSDLNEIFAFNGETGANYENGGGNYDLNNISTQSDVTMDMLEDMATELDDIYSNISTF